MESRAKFLGHAIHPMLIVFPLGLLSTAVIFDILYFIFGNPEFGVFSFWALSAGIVGGLAAGLFGAIDWMAIPGDTRAKSVGMWHGLGNVLVTGLFALSWLGRMNNPSYVPGLLSFAPAALGAIISLATAWLGGELVERLRVGVDDGAHLDSPNSLSDRPAHEGMTASQRAAATTTDTADTSAPRARAA